MALNDIENKNIGFYTTVTNNPVDATMLPVIFKKTGKLIISYSETDKNQTPHIWLGGNHIASGYGQDNNKDKENLSYISNSYNITWKFVENLDKFNPFAINEDYRAAVLKDSYSYSFSNNTLIIGNENQIQKYSENSIIFGSYNYLKGNNTFVTGQNNIIQSKNSLIAGSHIKTPQSQNQFIFGLYPNVTVDTLFALGYNLNTIESNIIEVTKDGSIYIKGIGINDKNNTLYDGTNSGYYNTQSFQSYISDALSYNIKFAYRYTDDRISNILGGAPDSLNSLKEIADYISDINGDNNLNYIPVSDYNKLNSSKKYYLCAWDINRDVNLLHGDELVEYILKEFWKSNIKTFNEILEKYNETYILDILGLDDSSILRDLNLNEEGLKSFYIRNGIYFENNYNINNDDLSTKFILEGQTVDEEIKSLYNFLSRYIEVTENIEQIYRNHNLNGLIYYTKENSTSLISSVHQIQNSYIVNNGTAKSNVGYTWVPSLGEHTYLNTILDAILERPNYTRPELNLIYESNIYEVGTEVTPQIKFDFGDTVRRPNIIDLNAYSNENLGFSYSHEFNEYLYGFEISITSAYYNSVKTLTGDIKTTYVFPTIPFLEEKDYNIASKVEYNYAYSTYMYYPQLLNNKNAVKVICTDGWFSDGCGEITNKYIISGKYKYYYGWDEIPSYDETNLNTNNCYSDWLNKNDKTEIKVNFNENHKLFWFAYPEIYTHENIGANNYFILYKTSLGEQDLISNSVDISKVKTSNKISTCGKRYWVYVIDFNREYLGEEENYIKFNIKRL